MRDLDYTPLTKRAGFRSRLRAMKRNNMTVLGFIMTVLLVVVPLIIFIALVATGNATDWGGIALLAMIFAGGCWGLIAMIRQAGGTSALREFARVNGLELVSGTKMAHYAGSYFATLSHIVHLSVRTRERAFVEIGDRFPIHAHSDSEIPTPDVVPGQVHVRDEPRQPELFFRARLAGHVTRDVNDVELVPADLDEALTHFAGTYEIEVSGDELTLFGSTMLDPAEPGRVQQAFALADTLVARANSLLAPTPTGDQARPEPAPRRPMNPWKAAGLLLAFLVIGPLAIAVVMSSIEDTLHGREWLAHAVVAVIISVMFAAVAWLAQAITKPRPVDDKPPSKWRRLWLIVPAVVVLVVAMSVIAAITDEGGGSDAALYGDKDSAAECGKDELECQRVVSTMTWFDNHDLESSGDFIVYGCEDASPGRRPNCAVQVECDGGYADLNVVFDGKPYNVVGARESTSVDELAVSHQEVQRLVSEGCT